MSIEIREANSLEMKKNIRTVKKMTTGMGFDENMAKEAWEARIETNDQEAEKKLINVCSSVINNLGMMTDARAKELISDAMNWVIKNPSEICYNISSKEQSLQISPNLVGFQSVILEIHQKLKSYS